MWEDSEKTRKQSDRGVQKVVENLYQFMGRKEKEYLLHAVTFNEYFEKLDLDDQQNVRQKQVYGLIRNKTF